MDVTVVFSLSLFSSPSSLSLSLCFSIFLATTLSALVRALVFYESRYLTGGRDGSERGVGHGQPLHRIEARSLELRARAPATHAGSRGTISTRFSRVANA